MVWWILGGLIGLIFAVAIFTMFYPWQSDPWGLTPWL